MYIVEYNKVYVVNKYLGVGIGRYTFSSIEENYYRGIRMLTIQFSVLHFNPLKICGYFTVIDPINQNPKEAKRRIIITVNSNNTNMPT